MDSHAERMASIEVEKKSYIIYIRSLYFWSHFTFIPRTVIQKIVGSIPVDLFAVLYETITWKDKKLTWKRRLRLSEQMFITHNAIPFYIIPKQRGITSVVLQSTYLYTNRSRRFFLRFNVHFLILSSTLQTLFGTAISYGTQGILAVHGTSIGTGF